MQQERSVFQRELIVAPSFRNGHVRIVQAEKGNDGTAACGILGRSGAVLLSRLRARIVCSDDRRLCRGWLARGAAHGRPSPVRAYSIRRAQQRLPLLRAGHRRQ